jgi:hypothetical protein
MAGRMVEPSAIHLWTWDARPYPLFPAAIDVWSDGPNWQTGHWLTGRLGGAPLDALVGAILDDAGVGDYDVVSLGEGPDGYVIDRPMSPRAAIEPLTLAYAFGAAMVGSVLRFRPRGGASIAALTEDDLVLPDDAGPCAAHRVAGNRAAARDFHRLTPTPKPTIAARPSHRAASSGGPPARRMRPRVVTNDAAMERRADIWLQDVWAGRERAEFALPPSALALTPGDVVDARCGGRARHARAARDRRHRAAPHRARADRCDVFALPVEPPRRPPPVMPPPLGPHR